MIRLYRFFDFTFLLSYRTEIPFQFFSLIYFTMLICLTIIMARLLYDFYMYVQNVYTQSLDKFMGDSLKWIDKKGGVTVNKYRWLFFIHQKCTAKRSEKL